LTKEIIIIRLNIFLLQDNKLVKIPQKFNLSIIPTTKLLIAEQEYKVMNAIFHHGSSIDQGYYVSMCREGRSLGLKLMRKLRKSNGLKVLKIFMYYFYKKVLIKICIKQHIIKYRCRFYIKQYPAILMLLTALEIYIFKLL